MFIELVDALRCPRDHDETWLVARIDRIDGRHITAGSLGCPICRAQFPIAEGVLDMRDVDVRDERVANEAATPAPTPNEEDVARAAALLGLAEPGGFVVLGGSAGALADALEALTSVNLMLVAPTPNVTQSPFRSIVLTRDRIPLAEGVAKGVMLDAATATPAFLASAQRVLTARGRLVAPASAPVPAGVEELARDEREWVGVKGASPSGIVTLGRA